MLIAAEVEMGTGECRVCGWGRERWGGGGGGFATIMELVIRFTLHIKCGLQQY
jgi:hypothetical protein